MGQRDFSFVYYCLVSTSVCFFCPETWCQSHWTYIVRTYPNIDSLLQPLENILRTTFILVLTSQDAPDDLLRDLLGLPCRAGGLGIPNPCVMSKNQFSNLYQ